MAYQRKKRVSHNKELRLAITTGDPLGSGPIIVEKALRKLRPQKNFQFLVWTDRSKKNLKISGFKVLSVKNLGQALKEPFNPKTLIEIKAKSPLDQLKEASKACLKKESFALITAPVKKSKLKGFKGQTEVLKRRARVKKAYMSFRGSFFNCVLFTDHIPLKKISLKQDDLIFCLKTALEARKFLEKRNQKKPVAVLGLNPHAGEEGLLGKEEERLLTPLLKRFPKKDVVGPLPPDTAFLKKNLKEYSFFVCLYHDQGLIPFKALHGHSGFSETLGLPYFRFGVSHGTAPLVTKKDLNFDSFYEALKEALKRAKNF